MGFHAIPERGWAECGISLATHSPDPVFDLTFANDTAVTSVISSVGFEPHSVWAALKGVPEAYPVKKVGNYTLAVTNIVPGHPQMLELEDPIAVPPFGTGRFTLHLQRFREGLDGNELLLRFCAVANGEPSRSRLIYLGVY